LHYYTTRCRESLVNLKGKVYYMRGAGEEEDMGVRLQKYDQGAGLALNGRRGSFDRSIGIRSRLRALCQEALRLVASAVHYGASCDLTGAM